MNNEPVAWMSNGSFEISTMQSDKFSIPLYTHPVKELTDELNQLLYSVNGDAYLGKDKEESLVKIVRQQYTKPVKQPIMVLDGNRVYSVFKELTDEEIWEVIDNCFGVHAFNLDYQIALDEAREYAFELVKVILRKAQ